MTCMKAYKEPPHTKPAKDAKQEEFYEKEGSGRLCGKAEAEDSVERRETEDSVERRKRVTVERKTGRLRGKAENGE